MALEGTLKDLSLPDIIQFLSLSRKTGALEIVGTDGFGTGKLYFHQGKVVTRSMIWEHLYDEHDENTSNVVDVYIRYLRTKIDKGFDPPLILTRWGEGYMLRGEDD